jgi:NADH-quinone oxidoreductase subunit N
MSWVHRAEVVFLLAALASLVLAPRTERWPELSALLVLLPASFGLYVSMQESGTLRVALLVVGGSLVVAGFLLHSVELHDRHHKPEGAALLLIAAIGGLVLVDGKNLLEMALGVEMISLSAATLVAMGHGERALEAGFKYFVLTAVTFATLLFGLSLIFLGTGSLLIPDFAHVPEGMRTLVAAGATLMIVGFGFKLALVPVHLGGLDAYTAGPPGFVAFIMIVSKLGAVVALSRLATGMGESIQMLVLVLGLVTIGWGVLGSFAQDSLRRLLAYSAVAHAGFLAIGAASGKLGMRAPVFYIACYAAGALLVFAAASGRGSFAMPFHKLPIEKFGPVRALGLIIGLASLAGIPPLPGFWAKVAVLKACWDAFGMGPTALAALGGVLGVIYYLRPVPELLRLARLPGRKDNGALIATLVSAAFVVVLGVAPGALWFMVR